MEAVAECSSWRGAVMRILIKGGDVLTVSATRDIHRGGYVVVSGDRIESVGAECMEPHSAFDRVIDASGMIVTPGLINMHQHPWMNLVKGLADGMLLEPWVFKFIQPFLDAISLEDIRASAYLSSLEMLRTGTTCVLDHTTRLPDGYEQALIEPMAEVGIRHVFAKLFQCRTPKLPRYPLSAAEAKSEAAELIGRYHGAHNGLVRMALAIECNAHHTELGKSSDELVTTGHSLAVEKNLRIPVHVSGGTLSMSMGFLKYLRLTQRRDVAYLENLGVLDDRWLLKHGIHFSEIDIESIRQRGAHVVYTPTSESIRGGGIGPCSRLLDEGVNCALGTDGPAVDYSVDMVEQMRACMYLQNAKHRDSGAITHEQTLAMATINAAKALAMDDEIGSLESGKRADIVIFDSSEPLEQSLHPLVSLIECGRGSNARTVLVNGEIRLDEGLLKFPAFHEVVKDAKARGFALARRAGLTNNEPP